ncbi:MAG TPA: transporter, partial [Telluria sp.]
MRIKTSALLRPLSQAVLCAALLSQLGGCVAVVAAGAVGTAVAGADRRTLGTQTEDQGIELKAATRLPNIVGDAGHVNVNSYDRKVLL